MSDDGSTADGGRTDETDGDDAADDPDGEALADVGETVTDGREKHVRVLLPDGEVREHGDVYLRHSESAFLVSPDERFTESATTRYEKSEVVRVEVTQHHAACFITTATAGGSPALPALRTFRDGTLCRSAPGRALVAVYERVSPPVAATLARRPDSLPARAVRRLVGRCGTLAERHRRAAGPRRAALAVALVCLCVVGVLVGVLGHVALTVAGR